jgi:hypothetical protein
MVLWNGRGRCRSVGRRDGDHGGGAGSKQRKKKEVREEEEGGLTGGATLSVRERKGEGCEGRRWAGPGPIGLKGRMGQERFRFVLFFSFSNTFIQTFQLKFKPKFYKLFTEFYKLLKPRTSNQKTMHSKIMMHKHLLSLN